MYYGPVIGGAKNNLKPLYLPKTESVDKFAVKKQFKQIKSSFNHAW